MTFKRLLTQYRILIAVVFTLLAWAAIFYFIPTETIIERIGLRHAYILAFAVSLLAGFSSLTGGTAYATVIEFVRGGADPLIIGVASGFGLFLSDAAFYLLLMRGRESVEVRFKRFFTRAQSMVERMPPIAVYLVTYLFCAFGPIPNDFILAVLMVSGFKLKRLWPVLLAGDITFMLVLSYIFSGT